MTDKKAVIKITSIQERHIEANNKDLLNIPIKSNWPVNVCKLQILQIISNIKLEKGASIPALPTPEKWSMELIINIWMFSQRF